MSKNKDIGSSIDGLQQSAKVDPIDDFSNTVGRRGSPTMKGGKVRMSFYVDERRYNEIVEICKNRRASQQAVLDKMLDFYLAGTGRG